MKEDAKSPKREEQTDNKYTEKKSIIHTLLKEYNKQSVVENSIANQLLSKIKISEQNDLKKSRVRYVVQK